MIKKNSQKVLFRFTFLMFFIMGCAGINKIKLDNSKITTLSNLNMNQINWETFSGEIQNGETKILLVKKDTLIPAKIRIETAIGSLLPGENKLKFHQDIYIYISIRKVLLSPDGKNWADISDMNSLKKLFGFKQGFIGYGIASSKEGTFFNLEIETK